MFVYVHVYMCVHALCARAPCRVKRTGGARGRTSATCGRFGTKRRAGGWGAPFIRQWSIAPIGEISGLRDGPLSGPEASAFWRFDASVAGPKLPWESEPLKGVVSGVGMPTLAPPGIERRELAPVLPAGVPRQEGHVERGAMPASVEHDEAVRRRVVAEWLAIANHLGSK